MPANQVQDLLYNVTGQSFLFDAPSRPASITDVQVFPWDAGDDDTEEAATTGSASIDAVSTTFDANSGVSSTNPRLLHLAATTNIVIGRQYLITTTTGETEWVEVNGITSGASVTVRVGLQNDYVTSDTFKGTRVSIAIANAWIQDSGKVSDRTDANPGYRVRWVWVDANSKTHVDFTDADIVRYAGADHGVSPVDMEAFHPLWTSMLPAGHREDLGAQIINAGFERLQDDLTALDLPDQQIRNRDVLQRMVRYAAARQLHYSRYLAGGELERYQAADREYQGMLDKLFRVETKISIGTGGSGAGTRASIAGVWSR